MTAPPEILDRASLADACASRLLETAPLVMRLIRQEMRAAAAEQLSIPQFRVLAFLHRHSGAPLSGVAGHLGVANATASTMVERLVRRGLVLRDADPGERRRVVLTLTADGKELLARARGRARAFLAGNLASLDGPQLHRLVEGLGLLGRAFARHEEAAP